MKKLTSLIYNVLFFTMLFSFAQCKKDNTSINITLYNKPLSTIQSNIQGNWKLQYQKGGICSTCINYFNDIEYLWEFGSSNKVKRTFNDSTFTDTTVIWVKDLGTYTNGDSTFIMNFYDKRLYPYNYIVDGIFDDTLILHDAYSADAVFYHFSKIN